jgi:hypothetical protein
MIGTERRPFERIASLLKGEFVHSLINQARSWGALLGGAPDIFTPRVPPPYFQSKRTPEDQQLLRCNI